MGWGSGHTNNNNTAYISAPSSYCGHSEAHYSIKHLHIIKLLLHPEISATSTLRVFAIVFFDERFLLPSTGVHGINAKRMQNIPPEENMQIGNPALYNIYSKKDNCFLQVLALWVIFFVF